MAIRIYARIVFASIFACVLTCVSISIVCLNSSHLSSHIILQSLDVLKVTNPAVRGKWGSRIPAPLIAAAAAVLPYSGRVLLFAADAADAFQAEGSEQHTTITALYDPPTAKITAETLTHTNHGMFCPGFSLDAKGRPFVTGGVSDRKVSIYNEKRRSWIGSRNMSVGRGYHAQVTLSNGNIFTIGGSWSSGIGDVGGSDKSGEVFEAASETWKPLPGCLAKHLLTNDMRGVFHSDNHAWLFAWKNDSVFQAGPSSKMNWYGTRDSGQHQDAGNRAQDTDSMNGNAIMYDAMHGKILTIGGATSYSNSSATRSAHIITLSEVFGSAYVQKLEPMHHPRVYANSVLLPTGDVFINGGSSYARQWSTLNATLTPELWSPTTYHFTRAARSTIPRTYHSIALLLPDATVLTGGGGLCRQSCWDNSINHLDLQIYYPPYIFDSYGRVRSQRPKIDHISNHVSFAGEKLEIITNQHVEHFALIKYSAVTHSINTDQRRVTLEPSRVTKKHRGGHRQWISEVRLPTDTGILTPGYWMIFAISKKGTPSRAATIQVLVNDEQSKPRSLGQCRRKSAM